MDEFALIHHYFTRAVQDPDVITGIGDDGAVLRPGQGREIVSVVDALVAGVHFPATISAADIGYRALAVNLSDIAAMGGVPRWMLLSLTLPDSDPDWLAGFAAGLFEAADEHAVTLVGGDTGHGSELVISIHLLGEVENGRALHRSGAAAGDGVWLTGVTGEAAAGLRLMRQAAQPGDAVVHLQRRFCRPTARVAVGRAINGIASAAIDLSDGLYADLAKLAASSGVGAVLELDALPVSAPLLREFEADARQFALAGGDDYELCFTAPPRQADAIGRIAGECGVEISHIGNIIADSGIVCRSGGATVAFDDAGFRHF